MPTYALDVAYASNITPYWTYDPKNPQPTAMAYGFTSAPDGGSFKEDGQKAESITEGSSISFTVLDFAPS